MDIQTTWVKPPTLIGGLDHLAVQAPCINIYGRMLPGITNVTDRARYYSFYPWVVWALEKNGHSYGDKFIDMFRRADCLFTLIAERHSMVTGGSRDDHSAATIGSANLNSQIVAIRAGKSIRLSEFTHREEGKPKYFKNKLGGLGQYYLGVFRELQIMDGSIKSGIKNVKEIGAKIAEAMDKNVNRTLFMATLTEDIVSVDRLDELHAFCPCRLSKHSEEHSLLCDLFFVKGLFANPDSLVRRSTLQTILSLSDILARNSIPIDEKQFRGCTYSGTLPGGISWALPINLHQTRKNWGIYQRNEILSMAVQGIFYAVLNAYEESGERFQSVEELCRWFLAAQEVEELKSSLPLGKPIGSLGKSIEKWLPEMSTWDNVDHEVQLSNSIETLCRDNKSTTTRSAILLACIKALLALKTRPETYEGYRDFVFPANYFQIYPINLQSFIYHCQKTWDDLTIREWLGWIVMNWGIKDLPPSFVPIIIRVSQLPFPLQA